MGLFGLLKPININQKIEEYKTVSGAVLLDVRTPQEYQEGHIPGSKNIPLQTIDYIEKIVKRKDTPLFVYCYSGARSSQAVGVLKRKGYTKVTNIGGIGSYTGKVER